MALNFGVLQEAGITQTEFADLLGVTRITVNAWVRGGTPTGYLIPAVTQLLANIQQAVDSGLFPGDLASLHPNRFTVVDRRQIIDAALTTITTGTQGEPA